MIETVVAIGILGVLGGLIFVGIQRSRASAQRASCSNNLRQIGQALVHFHDNHGRLPCGVCHPPLEPGVPQFYGPAKDPHGLMTWTARILPQIGQDALWKATVRAYARDPYLLDDPPHTARSTHLELYFCPADAPRTAAPTKTLLTPGPTSYLGVAGTDQYRKDGTLYLDSTVRFGDIMDGTSNTLLVGERPPSAGANYGQWYPHWGNWGTADVILGVRELGVGGWEPGCADGPYRFRGESLRNPCSVFHFWSLHSGGANFLFADGSVHFLSYGADDILPALATRAGREVVSLP